MSGRPRDPGRPLYKQLVETLEERMDAGRLKPGAMLPSELTLGSEFGVSRVTVRQALSELQKRGRIVRRQGKGTFVGTPPLNQQLDRQAKTIIEALRERGIEPEVDILGIDQVAPPQRVREAFGDVAPVTRLIRCYRHEAAPIALVYLYLPLAMSGVAQLLAREDHLKETTYSVFENELHIEIKEARHVIRISELEAEAAGFLNMEPGEPCLTMDRITCSEQDKVLELMTFYYPADGVRFEITLPRNERRLALRMAGE